MSSMPEYINNVPNISGAENIIKEALDSAENKAVFLENSKIDFSNIRSCFAVALHMHQPLIPAGGDDLRTAALISNLQYMMEHPDVGDNHNASVFHWCYKRMGEIIPQLVDSGHNPRVMLEYSGTLFHGLRKMGLDDVLDSLKVITCDPRYAHCVEWLGAPWGHAVAPSTPVQDYRLHVRAWQNHFAALFGIDALTRVRGFSPSEMALPNHPDIAYEFIKTLTDCGYQWILVQEHTVEQPDDGWTPQQPHLPHRLVCKNSSGETASIVAIVKTQGSDTKLVAQMQPAYEARSLERQIIAGKSIPPMVTQIADGENGGVMMNEFPPKYREVSIESSWSETPAINVTEYLEHLAQLGFSENDFPVIQPLYQKRIWERMQPGDGPEKLSEVIDHLAQEDQQFHMEGGSWTNDLSWVKGYEDVLKPMEEASAHFYRKVVEKNIPSDDERYR
ncbi:MAG: glycosyl hydrolase family 57, partial [Candidatus Thiodiazotropha sp. (ex Ctena orbiculata)]|nr:glycosyl hydrolase family 57 [Candidatus Thiodiazotropha taylori]